MKISPVKSPILRMGLILSTLATAGIHLSLNFNESGFSFDPMFSLNGIGFLVLLAGLTLDLPWAKENRRLVRYTMIAFSAMTVIAWIILGDKTWWVGWTASTIEVFLIALLVMKRP